MKKGAITTVNNNALRRNTQNSNSMGVVRANRSLMVPDQKMANKYYAPSKPVNNAKFQKEYAGKNNEYDKHSASSVVDAEIVYDGNIGSNPQSQLYDNSYEQSSNKLSNQITTRNSYDLERIRNNRAIAQAILNEKDAEEEKRVREYVRSTFQNALRDEKSEFMKKARINMEMAKTEQEIKNKLLNAKFGSQGFAKNSKRDAKYKKFVEDLINKEKKLKEQALKSQRGNNVKHNIDHNGPIIKNAVRSNNEIITQHNANSGIYNNSKMSNNGILFGGNFGLVDKNVSNNISQKTAFSAKEIKSGKQKIQIQNQTKPKNNLSKLPTENNKVMKTMAGGIFFNNDFKKSALSTPNQNEVQHKKVNSQFSNDGRFIEKTVKKVKSNDKSSNASGGAYIATNNGFIINKKEKK